MTRSNLIGSMAITIAMQLCTAAFASDAQTSATAGQGRTSNAAATARYEGDAGFARTDTRSGRVSTARGVAVGVDEDGLSLSISNAVATPHGPAVATSLNIGIERDGDVSISSGLSVANAPFQREASAGGGVRTDRTSPGAAFATATGRTDPLGQVQASTTSEQSRTRVVRGVDEHRPRLFTPDRPVERIKPQRIKRVW